MTTTPRRSASERFDRHSDERARRPVSDTRRRGARVLAAPDIIDAVHDQNGDRWIRYGTPEHAMWFPVADLITESTSVFRRLSSVGARCLTASSQSELKRKVEDRNASRDALVATHPGWLEGCYVFGDGTIVKPHSDVREVIVAFEPNSKFQPCGSLAEWQTAITPFVKRQPLPYFVLALAFAGPLLRFAPCDYLNLQVELVGKGEVGKSTLGVLAASVWAGNPSSDCGGGESWDVTLNALDPLKRAHRDGFLFLDEGNLAAATVRDRREFARQAVFKLATTGGKRRLGDRTQGDHASLALLSTTNTALADLIEGTADLQDAAQTRMITIRIAPDAPYGTFASIPAGFASARAASEAMRDAAEKFWGAAGRKFVKRLVREMEHDEERLKRIIAKRLTECRGQIPATVTSARVQKSFALVAVAAHLAKRWDILPAAWGSPLRMIQAVARTSASATASEAVDPVAAIEAYVERERTNLTAVADMGGPISRTEFEAASGFLHLTGSGLELLVPAARFQAVFPDYEAMMRILRDANRARTEGGRTPKLTIKTPRAICAEGRVYCVRLKSCLT